MSVVSAVAASYFHDHFCACPIVTLFLAIPEHGFKSVVPNSDVAVLRDECEAWTVRRGHCL